MIEVAVYDAKTRVSELLAAVEKGEQVTITRRGVAVARLVPATLAGRKAAVPTQRQRVAAVFAQLRQQRQGITLDVPLAEAIAAGRD